MADKQLAIALVGTDEASGVVGQSARKMAADLEALQKRTFDVGHDARARELRELSNHYDTLAAQYKAQHQRLAKYAADLEKQIGPGGLRILSPEWDAKFKELKQVRALMARNEDVQAGAAKAKKAEQDELSKQYEGAAAEKRAADLAAIERRIFDSSHSARDRELRDVREHADRLRAQYQSDAEMHAKIAEAEAAQVAEINKRYEQQKETRLGKLFASGRLLKASLSGVAVYAAGEVGSALADVIKGGPQETSARAGGQASEMVKARLEQRKKIQALWGWIPIIGTNINRIYDAFGYTKEEAALAEQAEKTSAGVATLHQNVVSAATGAARNRAAFLGYTPADMARLNYELGQRERAERLREAQEVYGQAASDYGRSRELGMPKEEQSAFLKKEQEAKRYLEQLQSVNAMEDEYAAKTAERAARIEKANFWRGIAESTLQAQFTGGPSLERRQSVETQLLKISQQAELETPEFAGLDERIKQLPNKAQWMKDYMARMRAQGNPGYTKYDAEKAWNWEFGRVAELQQQRAAIIARQGAQTEGQTEEQQYERMQWQSGLDLRKYVAEHGGITRAEARAREAEQLRARHEQEMGGPEGSPTRLKEGTEEYKRVWATQEAERKQLADKQAREVADAQTQAWVIRAGASPLQSYQRAAELTQAELAGRTEDPAVAAAKKAAIEERFRLEDEQRERRHQATMKDAADAAMTDREAHREREMERIAEGYAEELEKFKDNALKKQELLDEIAAKQKALKAQQDIEREHERAGLVEGAYGVAGGPFTAMAEQLRLKEKYADLRRQFAGNAEALKLINAMQPAEQAELTARENWLPHEVASRRGTWDAGRPSGYDNPMIGLTKEMQAFRQFLQNLVGNGGITKVLSFSG
jgi:hypothetical protein